MDLETMSIAELADLKRKIENQINYNVPSEAVLENILNTIQVW